ncbi:MAG: DUF2764 family protein [Candidatus Omnitrophica bacterium]|nr:DUF2764 family protein [Candidatus Omnitrophota bacterium]
MPAYYTYLVASLPSLVFGSEPPFSFQGFLNLCRPLIPEAGFNLLQHSDNGNQPTLQKWLEFDTALRNELVKIRAARKKIDPEKYLRRDGFVDPQISHSAINAYRNPSPLEGEMMLDQARWRLLDELCAGHYFDLDLLIIYAHKLLILERWQRIKSADSPALLEGLLEKGSQWQRRG